MGENIDKKIDKLNALLKELDKRVYFLENPKNDFVKRYEKLKVQKLYASLPIYTSSRNDTPQQGEIYLTSIGGLRKINAYIIDSKNQAWSATLS